MIPEAEETICCEGAVSLRITVLRIARTGHRPLYEAIVEEARTRGLAGAIVLRGVLGSDAKGEAQKAGILPLPEDLPLLIEIVDTPERIGAFLQDMRTQGLLAGGSVALSSVRRISHRPRGEAGHEASRPST